MVDWMRTSILFFTLLAGPSCTMMINGEVWRWENNNCGLQIALAILGVCLGAQQRGVKSLLGMWMYA